MREMRPLLEIIGDRLGAGRSFERVELNSHPPTLTTRAEIRFIPVSFRAASTAWMLPRAVLTITVPSFLKLKAEFAFVFGPLGPGSLVSLGLPVKAISLPTGGTMAPGPPSSSRGLRSMTVAVVNAWATQSAFHRDPKEMSSGRSGDTQADFICPKKDISNYGEGHVMVKSNSLCHRWRSQLPPKSHTQYLVSRSSQQRAHLSRGSKWPWELRGQQHSLPNFCE